jgi:hypothetical protein
MSYDPNSFSTQSFSTTAYDFFGIVGDAWRATKRFSLRVATAAKFALTAR